MIRWSPGQTKRVKLDTFDFIPADRTTRIVWKQRAKDVGMYDVINAGTDKRSVRMNDGHTNEVDDTTNN